MAYDTNSMIRDYLGNDNGTTPNWTFQKAPGYTSGYWDRTRDHFKPRGQVNDTFARYAPTYTDIDNDGWAALREQRANSGGFSSQYNPDTMDPRQDPRLNLNLSASTQAWDAPSPNLGAMPKPWEYEDRNGVMATNARLKNAQQQYQLMNMPSPSGAPGDQEAPLQNRLKRMETPAAGIGEAIRDASSGAVSRMSSGVNSLLGGNGGYGLTSTQPQWSGVPGNPTSRLMETLTGARGGYGLQSTQPVWSGVPGNPSSNAWTLILDSLLGGNGGYAFKQPRYGL